MNHRRYRQNSKNLLLHSEIGSLLEVFHEHLANFEKQLQYGGRLLRGRGASFVEQRSVSEQKTSSGLESLLMERENEMYWEGR